MQTITNLGIGHRAGPSLDLKGWELTVTHYGQLVGHAELPALRSDFSAADTQDLKEIFGRSIALGVASMLPHLYSGTSVDLGYGIKAEMRII